MSWPLPQFRTENRVVREAREERLQRVQDDALGSDGVDGVSQADKEPLQIVFARFLEGDEDARFSRKPCRPRLARAVFVRLVITVYAICTFSGGGVIMTNL